MIPKEEGISFYVIPWTEKIETRFSNEMVEKCFIDNEVKNAGSTRTVSFAVTRSEALTRAEAMCNTGWYYDASTKFTDTTTNTQSPEHLTGTSGNKLGIPYCWGGMNGRDTATYTGSSAGYLQNFSDCLTSDKTAGNIKTPMSGWVSTTFGIRLIILMQAVGVQYRREMWLSRMVIRLW